MCCVELLEFSSDDYKQWMVPALLSPPHTCMPSDRPRHARRMAADLRLIRNTVSASVNPLSLSSHSVF